MPSSCCASAHESLPGILGHNKVIVLALEAGSGEVRGAVRSKRAVNLLALEAHSRASLVLGEHLDARHFGEILKFLRGLALDLHNSNGPKGPLLELAGLEGGGLNIFGGSSQGKTTVIQAGASVWGRGDSPGYVRAWRATANGLEGVGGERHLSSDAKCNTPAD